MADTFNPRFYELGLALAAQRERKARAEEQRRQYEERMQAEKERAKQQAMEARLSTQMEAAKMGGIPWLGAALGSLGQPLEKDEYTRLGQSLMERPEDWLKYGQVQGNIRSLGETLGINIPPAFSPQATEVGKLAAQLRQYAEKTKKQDFEKELEKIKAKGAVELAKAAKKSEQEKIKGWYKLKQTTIKSQQAAKKSGSKEKEIWQRTLNKIIAAKNRGMSIRDRFVLKAMPELEKEIKQGGVAPITALEMYIAAIKKTPYTDLRKQAEAALEVLKKAKKPKRETKPPVSGKEFFNELNKAMTGGKKKGEESGDFMGWILGGK